MWDFSVGRSLAMVAQSWPFVLLRAVAYAVVSFCYVLLIGLGAGIGYGVGHILDNADAPIGFGVGGAAVGLGLAVFLFRLASEYLLYVVKAGHIAVLTALHDGRPVAGGLGQIEFGRRIVTERFAEASALFVLDQLIKAVLRVATGLFRGVGAVIPIPGLSALIGFFNMVVGVALTYADEVVLAYNIRSGVNDPWETSRRALVLYAQNGGAILKNAFWLAIFIWIVGVVVFLTALTPAGVLVYVMPGQFAGWSVVGAIAITAAVLMSVIEPFAVASLMQVYFKAIEGQAPNPDWDAKLAGVSRQFREIRDRAAADFGRSGAG